jgi:hypothetical protein
MSALRNLLADRRRSQRGSVLSAVLIIVAFLSILAGALMTELSTNFLLSNALVNRVSTQATVDSAVATAIDQLQNAPRGVSCPTFPSEGPNGPTAIVIGNCAPAVIPLTQPGLPINFDGALLSPSQGRYDYAYSDSAGTIYHYSNGSLRSPPIALRGNLRGPLLSIVDQSGEIADLVPMDSPRLSATPGCGSSNDDCVALLDEGPAQSPGALRCYMPANGEITARPAASPSFPNVVYFGDQAGYLWAYDSTPSGSCTRLATPIFTGSPVVAGPVVFHNPQTSQDEIYLVVGGSPSRLLQYSWSAGSPNFGSGSDSDGMSLGANNAFGIALEPGALPSRIAIAFAGSQIAEARIEANFATTLPVRPVNPRGMPRGTSFSSAPYWSHLPSGQDQIGIGGSDGKLYVLDANLANLNLVGSYLGPSPINTSPSADQGGDWFFGGADGQLYEVQPTMVLGATFYVGSSRVSSSAPLFGPCPTGSCIYFPAFIVPLSDRDVQLSACIGTGTTCSGVNPRLWAHVAVGSATTTSGASPQTVHVQGWSYYSP